LPYVKAIAELGWREAIARDHGLAFGLNVYSGRITHEAVARALEIDYRPLEAA